MTLLLSASIKVSLLVLGALSVTAVLRGRSAAVRHWVLAVALAAGLTLPALEFLLPAWTLPVPASWITPDVRSSLQWSSEPTSAPSTTPAITNSTDVGPSTRAVSITGILVFAWTVGMLGGLGVLLAGLLRLRRLVALSQPIESEQWQALSREVSREYGLHQPIALLHSTHPTMVVTWGLHRPTVLVPMAASAWSDERIKVVLRHELAHIRRGDWAVMLGAAVVQCIYWFNPLVWIAVKRLRNESERACDDLVLSAGISGADYATHLLEVARETATAGHAGAPAIALTHPSTLEGRIRAMLTTGINREPLTTRGRALMLVAALAVVVPIGVASLSARTTGNEATIDVVLPPSAARLPETTGKQPDAPGPSALVRPATEAGQARPGVIEGVLYDQFGGLLPGAAVTLIQVSTGGRYDANTDRKGSFTFRSLPMDDYELTTVLPGFSTVTNRIRVTDGSTVRRHITMPIGSITETVAVGCGTGAASPAPAGPASPSARDIEPTVPTLFSGGIGGQIKAPRKVTHVNPTCPPDDRTGQATVRVEGRIGIDGLLSDLHDVTPESDGGPAHTAYLAAAVESLRQWEFQPTLLNGAPVEVNIRVTIHFNRNAAADNRGRLGGVALRTF